MIDHRHVYINEQTNYRGKGRRVKIGIAKDVKARHRQTNSGLPGRWGVLAAKKVFFAHATEQFLHNQYSDFKTPLSNLKPGSGGSEIFTISSHQLAILRLTLGAMIAADVYISFSLVAIFCKVIFLLCYLLS